MKFYLKYFLILPYGGSNWTYWEGSNPQAGGSKFQHTLIRYLLQCTKKQPPDNLVVFPLRV